MKNKDPDYIAKLEKAIAEKYGKETITHPKADWDDEKETGLTQEDIDHATKFGYDPFD